MSDNPDEEQKEEEPPTFFGGLLKNIFYIIVYAIIGIAILYGCKVASANIIPTSLNGCKLTLTEIETSIDDGNGNDISEIVFQPNVGCSNKKNETTNINIIYKDDMYQSSKLEFNHQDNSNIMVNSGTIKWLMEMMNGPKSGHLGFYFGKILSTVVLLNLSLIDKFYKMINNIATSPFSESCVIFLLPYLLPMLLPVFIMVNLIAFGFCWFYFMKVFWSERNPEAGTENPAHPEPVSWNDKPTSWWILLYYFIGFCGLFLPMMMGMFVGMIMPFYCIFFPLFAVGHLKGTPEGETFNIGDFIMSTLKFKKHVFMYVFSYYMIKGAYDSSAENGLGVAITALFVILLIWFFDNMFGVFKPYEGKGKDHLSVFLKGTISKKTDPPISNKKVTHSGDPREGPIPEWSEENEPLLEEKEEFKKEDVDENPYESEIELKEFNKPISNVPEPIVEKSNVSEPSGLPVNTVGNIQEENSNTESFERQFGGGKKKHKKENTKKSR